MFRILLGVAVLGLTSNVQAQHHPYDGHAGAGHYPAWHGQPEYDYHDECEYAPPRGRYFHRPLVGDGYPCEWEYSRPHCPFEEPYPPRYSCPYDDRAVGVPTPFAPRGIPQPVVPQGQAPGVDLPRAVQPIPPMPGREGAPDNRAPRTNQPPLPPQATPSEAPASPLPDVDVPPNAPIGPENGRGTPQTDSP
jgi:hypothetical protein